MVVGIAIMNWDERIGTEIVAKFPDEVTISDKTLMQIYSTHEYTGESGMISLMVGSLNIASYYTGPEFGYYIILLLTLDEDPDIYEGQLADVSRQLLMNIDDPEYIKSLPLIFQRLAVFPKLNGEQILALTYNDEVKRAVIKRLQEEGIFSKSELSVWLKDKYIQGNFDIESILIDLIKREMIKEASVKGVPSELIFLIKDYVMLRVPPEKIIENPADHGLPQSLVDSYLSECKKFFEEYTPSEEDNLKLVEMLVDPEFYETLQLLRMAIVTRDDLEKLKKKGVEDTDGVLKKLWEAKMIQVLQDEQKNEYFALISDFFIDLIFPEYNLRLIKKQSEQRSKSDTVLIEYANVLKDSFIANKEVMEIKRK